MLSKKNRIQNHRLIDKLHKEGETYRTSHLVIRFLPSPLQDSKFVVSVSKKVAGKAVDRNKLRRQITEALRKHLGALKSPISSLITLKKGAPPKIDYHLIESEVLDFLNHTNP